MVKKGHQCPPYFYLYQLSTHFPQAVSIYMDLWNQKNELNRLKVYKSNIEIEYLTKKSKFRNALLLLVKEGLVSFDDKGDCYYIELVGWDEEEIC